MEFNIIPPQVKIVVKIYPFKKSYDGLPAKPTILAETINKTVL